MARRSRPTVPDTGTLSLTQARQLLSPLIKSLPERADGKVGIAVRGKTRAYLVSDQHLEWLERKMKPRATRRSIRGSLIIVGDLDEALREVRERETRHTLRKFDRLHKR